MVEKTNRAVDALTHRSLSFTVFLREYQLVWVELTLSQYFDEFIKYTYVVVM